MVEWGDTVKGLGFIGFRDIHIYICIYIYIYIYILGMLGRRKDSTCCKCLGILVWGLGFGVWGLGLRV